MVYTRSKRGWTDISHKCQDKSLTAIKSLPNFCKLCGKENYFLTELAKEQTKTAAKLELSLNFINIAESH